MCSTSRQKFKITVVLILISLLVPVIVEAQISQNDFYGVSIGTELSELLTCLGEPERIDPSGAGFNWYIYNQDYNKYLQVGICNDEVLAITTNVGSWTLVDNVHIGSVANDVRQAFGEPFKINTKASQEYFKTDDYYVKVYYDLTNNPRTVIGIYLLSTKVDDAEGKITYAKGVTYSPEVISGMERQVFDMTNAIRVSSGKNVLVWHEEIANVVRGHVKDMSINDYFAHTTPGGVTFAKRLQKGNINYCKAAENIAAGHRWATDVMTGWMNSEGHRRSLFSENTYLGVGCYTGGTYRVYFGQNFYTAK